MQSDPFATCAGVADPGAGSNPTITVRLGYAPPGGDGSGTNLAGGTTTGGRSVGGTVLRGALERDGRQMSTSAVEADSEMERNSGLTADQSPRQGARRASRPPWAGFEARHPGCKAPMVISLVGCGSAVWTAPPSKIGGPLQSTQFLAVSHARGAIAPLFLGYSVHPLREIGLVAADRTQRLDQVGDRVGFDEVTARPRLSSPRDQLARIVHGNDQHLRLGQGFANLARGFQSARPGHADVHHHDVG